MLLQKSDNACVLHMKEYNNGKKLLITHKVPTDGCLQSYYFDGYSAILQCFSESRARSRNSTTVPTLQDLSSFMFVFAIELILKFFDWQ